MVAAGVAGTWNNDDSSPGDEDTGRNKGHGTWLVKSQCVIYMHGGVGGERKRCSVLPPAV